MSSTGRQPAGTPVALIALTLLAGLLNFAMAPLTRVAESDAGSLSLLAFVFGLVTAETGVLALWLVWCPWSLWLRMTVHWLIAVLLFSCWIAGFFVISWVQRDEW